MSRFLTAITTIALLACLAIAATPVRAAEVQVAFDAAGRIQRVDAALARRIGLFVDRHPGFQEARLFASGDSAYVLEITTMVGGQLAREREVLTRDQADALRADVVRRLGDAGPVPEKLEQDGRTTLVAGNVLLGLGFYGWAVPYAFDAQDPSVALGSYMVTAGASFFVPLMLTQNSPVTWGMSSLSLYGSTRGIAHGLLLYEVVNPNSTSEDEGRARVALAMAASISEGAIGYAVARRGPMSPGTAETIVNGGDYGLLWGYVLSDLADYTEREDDRSTAAVMLASTLAGMTAAGVLAAHRAYSFGDGLVMRSSGYVGMLIGTAIADVGNPGGSKSYSAGVLAGSAAGLVVGDRLVAGREFTRGEGVLVQLGGAAGALMGLGVVALGSPEGPSSSTAYWFGTAIGGTAGYALTYRQLAGKAAARSSERTSWRFDLAPEGMLTAMDRAPGAGLARAGRRVPPLARLTCTF